jgi:hypothetical protein
MGWEEGWASCSVFFGFQRRLGRGGEGEGPRATEEDGGDVVMNIAVVEIVIVGGVGRRAAGEVVTEAVVVVVVGVVAGRQKPFGSIGEDRDRAEQLAMPEKAF